LLEEAGEFADAVLPGGAVDDQRGRRRKQLCRWLFGGEVWGTILLFGANLLLGLDLQEAVERLGIAAVGGEPEAAG